ncbi:MAG TPA: tRNA uridine-5-carboxymethylaminomethyl(34) synthesis GTPase MnmE, partial [Bacilli bacterium]|nr:tRNA uridine-5-carboxymethylaminomethyl(34) synthesis GTPase MnmE [Bacilli bacterium]
DYTYIGNARQIAKLKQAYQYLLDAQESIKQERPIDIIGLDLTNAWNTLGEIIGEVGTDQLINELFSQFCLGK